MRLRPLTHFLAGSAVVVLTSSGCSAPEENDVPIIDSVEAPSVVKAKNGNYEIPVLILFHDNDREAVTHVRYRFTGTRVEGMIDIPTPVSTRESVWVTVVVPKAGCGPQDRRALEITVLDARGGESHPLSQILDLD